MSTLLPSITIKSPTNYKCKIKKYLNYLMGKGTFSFEPDEKRLSFSNNH